MDGEESNTEQVKSTAVVKYSVPKPTKFIQLQCNTDLNLPPSNWLSSSADLYGLQHALTNHKGFSSFRMAQMFPDCVGEVDVISGADNIKKLLKIPYHKGHISMMVHRIENTLLLDDFDIYKHLLMRAKSDWEWLKTFFIDQISNETYEEDKQVFFKNRTRSALKQKSLISKFLYHSLGNLEIEKSELKIEKKSLPNQTLLLPEPSPSSEAPDTDSVDDKYNQNVVWTFEDIEMLLGTDMPIFGGGTYPCISLRLRDMNKPINVLTGIDYWLDNLMSNVPEVVMCYHLNGIVQKYELIKTEDLPRLNTSKFSPNVIRDVAQSILSFLKSNATKPGHTYWLFKGKDEEVVKLYDLTSLCQKEEVDIAQNPFTIPVAMLLYRVARNMMNSNHRKQPGTIRMLLKNCLKLLPEEKYPEIVTSSHYMLAELHVPAGTNPECPGLENMDTDEEDNFEYEDDLPEDEDADMNPKLLDLESRNYKQKFTNYYKPPPPIFGSLEDRCMLAIQHVSRGLSCLKYFPEKKPKDGEEEVPMAKAFVPIPMPYESLNKEGVSSKKKRKDKRKKVSEKNDVSENALLIKNNNEAQALPTWKENLNNISWKDHLKTLLYEKALLVYAILAENHYVTGHYGNSLRCIGIIARCQMVMNRLLYSSNALRENCLLGRAGDCFMQFVKYWTSIEEYRKQLQNNSDEDFKMMECLEIDERFYDIEIGNSNLKCVFVYDLLTIEQLLLKAIDCYEEALITSETKSILLRLGNGLNETGTFFLNKAKLLTTQKDIIDCAKLSETYLVRGLEVFEKLKDDANIALLHTNMGYLHRLLAFAATPEFRSELTPAEKMHFNKQFLNYKKALQVLGDRKYNPAVWDAVIWELSTALFNMATIMHENPSASLTKIEAEKEVIEILQKALKYCDLDENNSKFPVYQYRAAIIHYRMGSLYHNHIWSTSGDGNHRKNIIQLAKINYEKASKLYFLAGDVINYITSQMQRFALSEYLAETASLPTNKVKHLQDCLGIVIEINEVVTLVATKKIDVLDEKQQNPEDAEARNFKTCYSLLNLVKQRLQYILKRLIKLCLSKPPPNKNAPKLAELYKNCYKISFDLKEGLPYNDLVSSLNTTLSKISCCVKECDL